MLLSVLRISKFYGPEQVLKDISFQINTNQRVGLVGENGVGKSTLLKIVAGEIEADAGEIAIPGNIDIGYLPQAVSTLPGKTIEALIYEAQNHLRQLETRMKNLEELMSASDCDQLDEILAEYGNVTEAFERRGGYNIDYKIDIVLQGLKLNHISKKRDIDTLSGGEKERVGLAALLLRSPDLLLLDEPTNHLDFATLKWLEIYIQSHHGALLVVSHDRQFLNRTVGTILEIVEHSREIKQYTGNYDAYLAEKERERARWEEDYQNQQEAIKELKRAIRGQSTRVGHNRAASDPDKFAHKFFGERVQQRVSANIRTVKEKLQRIQENPVPRPPDPMRINPEFSPRVLEGKVPLIVSGVCKSFGKQNILNNVSFTLDINSRVVLLGPNGTGKSTLLKIIAGLQKPDAGGVTISPSVKIGYLDQEQEALDLDKTLFEVYKTGLTGHEEDIKAMLFRYGLFVYADIHKQVKNLSIGQRRKLQIARLIAEQVNFLLLDEPTNHVSFDILEEFERALLHFPGPVLAVSHDRRFIEGFANQVWEICQGELVKYQNGYQSWLASIEELPVS